MTRRITFQPLLAIASVAITLYCVASASAASVSSSITFEVTSVNNQITDIDVGDCFRLDITINDQVTDTHNFIGRYPELMTSLSATADPGNTGSWSPNGTLDVAGGNYVSNTNSFTWQIRMSGNPSSGPPRRSSISGF
jgi:hypothetical protein